MPVLNALLVTMLFVVIACVGLSLTAVLQYLKLYILRRWVRRVRWPDPCGFCREISVRVGEPILLCLHSSRPVSVELARWGADGPDLISSQTVGPVQQSRHYDVWTGCQWEHALTIPTEQMEPGLYVLTMHPQGAEAGVPYRCVAIVQPAKPVPVSVVASTNTWQAYNPAGGLSNYDDVITPWPLRGVLLLAEYANLHWVFGDRHHFPIVPLPLKRPNEAIHDDLAERALADPPFSHLLRSEIRLIELLERESVPYALYSDLDFTLHPEPSQADLLIFTAHSEYWTPEAEARLALYGRSGGCTAFLSGNNMYRTVQLIGDALVVTRQQTDARSVAARLGCAYDARGYCRYAPYRLEQPDHWAFAGTGLVQGDVFGETRIGGASGYETDKPTAESAEFQILAVGVDPAGPAFMVYRESFEGGWIFNAASVAFTGALHESPELQRVVLNLIERATAYARRDESVRKAVA